MSGWLAFGGLLVAAATLGAAIADRRREQASGVFAIVEAYRMGPGPDSHTTVSIHNLSPAPVFDAGVSVYKWGRRRWCWRVRRRVNWWTGARIPSGVVYPTILPGVETEHEQLPGVDAPTVGRLPTKPDVIVTFTDASGRRWVRWPDSRLSRDLLRRSAF